MDDSEFATAITRQELYDLVWSTPLPDLADRFGTTTIDLATTCAGWRIPLPDRAWWRAKRDGAKGIQRPLPEGAPTQEIRIHARDPRRWLSSDELTEYVSRLAAEATEQYRVVVPNEGEGIPHVPFAADTQLRPRKVKVLEQRVLRSLIRIRTADCLPRALRILTAIGDAFRQRGYFVVTSDTDAVTAVVWGVDIKFHIQEGLAQRPPVAAGIKKKVRPVRCEVSTSESTPSGILEILIDEQIENERRIFSDSHRRPLENVLDTFFMSLLRIAMRRRAERNRVAVLKQQDGARRARKSHPQKTTEEVARERQRNIAREIVLFRRAQSLRCFMDAVKDAATREDGTLPPHVATWLRETDSIYEQIDPVRAIIARTTTCGSARDADLVVTDRSDSLARPL